MSTTRKAVIHLGEDYYENLVAYKNINFDALKTLFDTEKLILDHEHETKQVSTIERQVLPWMRFTVLHDKVIMLSKANVETI